MDNAKSPQGNLKQPNTEALEAANKKENKNPQKFTYVIYILVALVGFFIAKIVLEGILKDTQVKTKEVASSPPNISAPIRGVSMPGETKIAPVQEKLVSKLLTSESKPTPKLALTGIIFEQASPCALINDRIVKEGDVVEGARVIRISSNEVSLEFEGRPIRLNTK